MQKTTFPEIDLVELAPSDFQKFVDVFTNGSLGHLRGQRTVEKLLAEKNASGARFFLAVTKSQFGQIEQGRTVGVCGVSLRKNEALLFGQYVIPSFRKAGFGASILRAVESFAKANGAKVIVANLYWRHQKQIKRFWKQGFRPSLSRPVRVDGKVNFFFKKRLK